MRVGAIDIHFCKHWKTDAIIYQASFCEFFDTTWLLISKLVAGKAEYDEVAIFVLFI